MQSFKFIIGKEKLLKYAQDINIFMNVLFVHEYFKLLKWVNSNVWLGVRVCVQNTPTYNSLTATTHPRGFTFVSAFGTAALPTLDRSDPRDLPFDHTVTDFLNFHPEIIVGFF